MPNEVYVAFSGGIDSVAVVDFLSRKHKVNLVFFHHGNDLADQEEKFIRGHYSNFNIIVGKSSRDKKPSESMEEYWRNERYSFFKSLPYEIITCHHLDDCVETWIWSSMHGNGKIIPYANENVIRPFRMTCKNQFESWVKRNELKWFEDHTNSEEKFMRNYIRKNIIPHALHVNPGLHKVILKKVKEDYVSKK